MKETGWTWHPWKRNTQMTLKTCGRMFQALINQRLLYRCQDRPDRDPGSPGQNNKHSFTKEQHTYKRSKIEFSVQVRGSFALLGPGQLPINNIRVNRLLPTAQLTVPQSLNLRVLLRETCDPLICPKVRQLRFLNGLIKVQFNLTNFRCWITFLL